jgi:hypothetical protein
VTFRAATLALCAVLAAGPGVALAQRPTGEPAAIVLRANGEVSASDARGTLRQLAEGDPVFVGETIETGPGRRVYVALRFGDDTEFALGRSSTMQVNEFVYGRSVQDDRIGTRVLKGVFRFVSGLIARARSRSMGVTLPVATIGIRGTTVAGEVEGDRATVVLLESETPRDTPSAIEVSNEHGSVTIDQTGFGTEIPDADSPPSAPRRMRVQTIENLMRSLQSLTRISAPRPRPPIR